MLLHCAIASHGLLQHTVSVAAEGTMPFKVLTETVQRLMRGAEATGCDLGDTWSVPLPGRGRKSCPVIAAISLQVAWSL